MSTYQSYEQPLMKERLEMLLDNAIESQREVKRTMNKLTSVSIIFFCLAVSIESGVISTTKIKGSGVAFEINTDIAFSLFVFIASIFSLLRTFAVINLYTMREKISKYYYLQFKEEVDMAVLSSPTIINLFNRAARQGIIGFCVVFTLIGLFAWQSLEVAPHVIEVFERQNENGKNLLLLSSFLIVLSGIIEGFSGKAASYLAN
jgi:hypothetical protein